METIIPQLKEKTPKLDKRQRTIMQATERGVEFGGTFCVELLIGPYEWGPEKKHCITLLDMASNKEVFKGSWFIESADVPQLS